MKNIIVEICCGSADDVIQSKNGGADRVELNLDLFHGGLTPTIGELITAKEMTNIEIMTMVRPRCGGFDYTDAEFKTALADTKLLLEYGADGIVFGFLNSDGTINIERCKRILDIIGTKQSVFHRAIDVTPNWEEAIDILADLHVTRVLTSGQEPSVPLGVETIARMIKYAGERIQILPGAGINSKNVKSIIEKTGCSQIHFSSFKKQFDNSINNNNNIFYGGALYPREDQFEVTDSNYVQTICGLINP